MAKILLSPLFLTLIGLIIVSYRKKSKLCISIFLLLWIISMPVVSAFLASYLESPYADYNHNTVADVEVVTVLSGGILRGPTHELDKPCASTMARVIRGARAFKESDASLLIMQGYSSTVGERMTIFMKELAIDMGIEEELIIREPYSRNTFEHPIELIEIINETDKIAVVTSAWHLNRAVREFEQYYDEVIPVPAEFYSYNLSGGMRDWLPQVSALEVSTKVIHELIGMMWYRVKG